MTTWQRHVSSVIPVIVSIQVPANGTPPPLNAQYVYATVADPLVNKFPGDWTVTNLASPPPNFTGMSEIPDPKDDGAGRSSYTETASGFRASRPNQH